MIWRTWFCTTHSPLRRCASSRLDRMRISSLADLFALPRSVCAGHLFSPRYSPQEVRARLHDDNSQSDPRTAAVHAAAAEAGGWMRLLPNDAYREHRLGLAATRLPSVIFWYRQGVSPEQIGRRLTPFGGGSDGDRAIAAACGLIAALLNTRPRERRDEHYRRG